MMTELSALQRDMVRVLVRHGPLTGQEVREHVRNDLGHSVLNGTLYPNLNGLVEDGIVEKWKKNERANYYAASESGREMLASQFEFDKGALA